MDILRLKMELLTMGKFVLKKWKENKGKNNKLNVRIRNIKRFYLLIILNNIKRMKMLMKKQKLKKMFQK